MSPHGCWASYSKWKIQLHPRRKPQISAVPADFQDVLAPRNHNYRQAQGRGVIRPIPSAQQSLGLSLQGWLQLSTSPILLIQTPSQPLCNRDAMGISTLSLFYPLLDFQETKEGCGEGRKNYFMDTTNAEWQQELKIAFTEKEAFLGPLPSSCPLYPTKMTLGSSSLGETPNV